MSAPLLSQLRQAKNDLEDAQIAYCGASASYVEAKRTLELAEATRTLEGIDGKNEKERAAKLRFELAGEYEVLHEAEDALAEARCALEVAKLEWELARYSLRALELSGCSLEVAA